MLGHLIEPYVNSGQRYRNVNVRVGSSIKPGHEEVPRLMNKLLDAQDWLNPDEWFKEYEEVHPFADGNGRSGVILFNYLGGTMQNPVWPPNFWGDPRRTVGHGA